MKKYLITAVGLAICVSFLSCSIKNNNSIQIAETPINIEIKDSASSVTDDIQFWHATNKKVIVLFGYDYNDANFISRAKEKLSNKFGLSENGGLIIPVVFPDDFRHKDKAVTVDLFNILDNDENDIIGFISLGAPENTYRALTKLQDKWNGQIPFPVISFFPQDDILGIEDTSSIVINQVQKAETEENLITESVQTGVSDADEILSEAVAYMLELSGAPDKDAKLASHVRQMIPNKKIHRYTDSETGLFAINHFVIE